MPDNVTTIRPSRVNDAGGSSWLVVVAGAAILAAAMGIGRFAYTPLLPPMIDAFGWTLAQAGDVASANFLGYLLGALIAGYVRHPLALPVALLATVLTTAGGALVSGYTPWLLLRFASGVASAFCLVLATGRVMDALMTRGRATWAAAHFGGVGLGIVLSVLVILAARWQVFPSWAALGAVSAVLVIVGGVLLNRVAGVRAGGAVSPQGKAPAPGLWRLIVAYGGFGFGYVITATFIVDMARRVDGSPWLEPAAWLVVGATAMVSVVLWQHAARRYSLLGVLRIAYALEAVGVLLAGVGHGPVLVILGAALLGLTIMGITALGLSAGRIMAGRRAGPVVGWLTASFGVGQFLGPAIGGRLAALTDGFGAASAVAAAVLLLSMVLLPRTLD